MAKIREDEISEPVAATNSTKVVGSSFGRKLREALEALPVGQQIQIRTHAERQQISNIVGDVQKKLGVKFSTEVVTKRNEDPDNMGRLTIQISKKGAATSAAD